MFEVNIFENPKHETNVKDKIYPKRTKSNAKLGHGINGETFIN